VTTNEREEGVRILESIGDHAGIAFEGNNDERNCLERKAEESLADETHRTPTHPDSRPEWNVASAPWRRGGFYKCLSAEAMSEFESAGGPFYCPETTVLFEVTTNRSHVDCISEACAVVDRMALVGSADKATHPYPVLAYTRRESRIDRRFPRNDHSYSK
jgi:hypothetical protein